MRRSRKERTRRRRTIREIFRRGHSHHCQRCGRSIQRGRYCYYCGRNIGLW